MEVTLSNATLRNWQRLNKTFDENSLTKRANKQLSNKTIIPIEYCLKKEVSVTLIRQIREIKEKNNCKVKDIIYSIGILLLKKANINNKQHVLDVLRQYDCNYIDLFDMLYFPNDEFDILGFIYQSLLSEGEKIKNGSYYTSNDIIKQMTNNLDFSLNQTLLDPCCGSGAFLLTVNCDDPALLYGVDIDETACMIAKINLLIKYSQKEFIPNIYTTNYICEDNDLFNNNAISDLKFDYIITNPPWGGVKNDVYVNNGICSKETFSLFFVKAYKQLKENGLIDFLFPEAILNVRIHKDIRQFMLTHGQIKSIIRYSGSFTGVLTKYVSIVVEKSNNKEYDYIEVLEDKKKKLVNKKSIYLTNNLVYGLLSDEEYDIIKKIKQKGEYNLKDSIWALGIVTGNNNKCLLKQMEEGCEEIYTGKEITPYKLLPAKRYIRYDRNSYQQIAKEEYYRAKEKLVYKFISSKLVFAYDENRSLFLNSANILIPKIPNMSTKTVMAFLNSHLFQYMYEKMFGQIKVLQSNLIELPFLKIDKVTDDYISNQVDKILDNNLSAENELQDYIYNIYELNNKEINIIKQFLSKNGKT